MSESGEIQRSVLRGGGGFASRLSWSVSFDVVTDNWWRVGIDV